MTPSLVNLRQWTFVLCCVLLFACTHAPQPSSDAIAIPGVNNVYRLSPWLISGSAPYNEATFQALSDLGVRTVISVDGLPPNHEKAAAHGMRYVHIPIGYGPVPDDLGVLMCQAVAQLSGPFYVHCHRGLHRGPAAAMLMLRSRSGWSADKAVQAMRRIGTSERYPGLYDSVREFRAPSSEVLETKVSFDTQATLPALVHSMAEIDRCTSRLEQCQDNGWRAPAEHPDVDPPQEAVILAELLRELIRSEAEEWDMAFGQHLKHTAAAAQALESALRTGNHGEADKQLALMFESCTSCHNRYRD